jgi:hypothetical protein
MLRNLLSVLASFLTGWVFFTFIQLFSYILSPKPVGMDFDDSTMVKEFMAGMPMYSWALVIVGYVLGSLAAGFVIGKFAESPTRLFPFITATVFTVGWLVNIMTFPHPLWIVITVFPIYFIFVFLGHSLGSKSRVGKPDQQ